MTVLEQYAREAWRAWGHAYAQWNACTDCGEMRHCRARSRRGPWLCLDCHSQR